MTVVYEQGLTACGGAARGSVRITLWGAGRPIGGRDFVNGTFVRGVCVVDVDSTGYWEADLVPNDHIIPENTTYKIERQSGCEPVVSFISVPVSGGPFEALTIEGDPMNSLAPSALASHAADTSLHAGNELASASMSIGVATSSATFVDVTGMAIAFTVPNRPYRVEFSVPMFIVVSGAKAVVQLIHGSSSTDELFSDEFRATAANDSRRMGGFCRVPNVFHAPAPGTLISYKLQFARPVGTGDISVIPDLFGGHSIPILQAVAQ